MTKYIIRTVELVKKVYLIEAYSKSEAYDKLIEMGPKDAVESEVLGDHIFHEETINEYEYNKEWQPKTKQEDWVDQGKLGTTGDRLKGPALNVMEDDLDDLYRDD